MHLYFLLLPICDGMAKIVNNFVWGVTFENQMLGLGGDCRFDFYSDGEKRAARCRSKMGDGKVGVNQKYVPYTYKKLLTVVHTNAPLT